jgi:hypothetical protein
MAGHEGILKKALWGFSLQPSLKLGKAGLSSQPANNFQAIDKLAVLRHILPTKEQDWFPA